MRNEKSKLGLVLDQMNLLVPDKLVLDQLLGLDPEHPSGSSFLSLSRASESPR